MPKLQRESGLVLDVAYPTSRERQRPTPLIGPLEQDERWQAVARILSSESFGRSSRLSDFLAYVAERTLSGKEAEITEQQIGVHVFGRPTGYNPGEDNIVRQSARQLRQRLALFYQEEGRDERIQVLIPKGAYITLFQLSAAPKVLDVAPAELPGPLDKESLPHSEGSPPAERPGLVDAESIRYKSLELVQRRPSLRSLTVIITFLLGASSTLIGNLAWQRLRHPTTSSNKVGMRFLLLIRRR